MFFGETDMSTCLFTAFMPNKMQQYQDTKGYHYNLSEPIKRVKTFRKWNEGL